ncbi:MAG TPA: hypothetical protein VMU32_08925 [Solirubrobacteraceae bacterium]|nr:hypothetical protein [Solirubrobacteraceae bacterium]
MALAAILLGGCGSTAQIHTSPVPSRPTAVAGGGTATVVTPVPGTSAVAAATTPPMSSDAPTVSSDVFARHESQSTQLGVSVLGRSRSAYCGRESERGPSPRVVVELPSDSEDGKPRPLRAATLGQTVEICPYGFRGDLPMTLEWVSGGRALRRDFPAGQLFSERTWTVLLDSRFATGTQTITARQGDLKRTVSLAMGLPRAPVLASSARFEAPAGEPVSVLVAGVKPHASVHVGLYAVPNEGNGDVVPQYRTTLELTADARGLAETDFLSRPSDEGQYVLSLQPRQQGEEEQAIPIELDENSQSFAGPVGLAPGEKPTGVFETHAAPPAGVAAQISYFVGAGGSSCYSRPHATEPTIAFGRVVPRVPLETAKIAGAAPQIGDVFFLCAEHFPPGNVQMTVTSPNGERERVPLEGQSPLMMHTRTLLPGTEIGTYTVTALQGPIRRTAHYQVSYPGEPGDVMLDEPGSPPRLLVVGLPPHQRYRVLVYETPGGAGGPRAQARYNGSIERETDAHGVDMVPFEIGPHDPHTCFVMRVQYGEHVVVDKEEGQTSLCIPLQSGG